ncbi:MAG: phosphatidylglycerophosphatase A [Pseudomonadales bacterium]|nr:phosphatidylglycerophosphatase A [Pseudomonadales bacterium]
MSNSVPPSAFKNPIHFLAIGLGSGAVPKAPGTWGTIMAVILFLPLSLLALPYYILMVILAALIGIYFCGRTSKDWGVHDHGGIVWDEFVGFWITMIAVPVTWYWVLLGFLLFRLFDIWKPWPISYLDKHVHGGLGIMLDDIVAGLISLGILHVLLCFV